MTTYDHVVTGLMRRIPDAKSITLCDVERLQAKRLEEIKLAHTVKARKTTGSSKRKAASNPVDKAAKLLAGMTPEQIKKLING